MERFRPYLTRTKIVGYVMLAYAILTAGNTLVDGWDNLGRIDWDALGRAAQHPVFVILVAVAGVLWILFVGDKARLRGDDWVSYKGLRWRRQTFNDKAASPYPYCPTHDLKLLWEANDKTKASWQFHDVATGHWFGPGESEGHLHCPSGGHNFSFSDSWMVGEAVKLTTALLEAQERKTPTAVLS